MEEKPCNNSTIQKTKPNLKTTQVQDVVPFEDESSIPVPFIKITINQLYFKSYCKTPILQHWVVAKETV